MPHDRHGRLLKVGDLVLIACTITHLDENEDYCNVNLETVHGRRPDGLKEHFSSINTGVLELVGEAIVGQDPPAPKKNVQERLADLETRVGSGRCVAGKFDDFERLTHLEAEVSRQAGILADHGKRITALEQANLSNAVAVPGFMGPDGKGFGLDEVESNTAAFRPTPIVVPPHEDPTPVQGTRIAEDARDADPGSMTLG